MDLTSFQHSLFLSALGSAILNSLWQSFLLWIIYEMAILSYKRTDAKFKHNLSVLFIFCSFVWFIFTFLSKLRVSETISTFVTGANNSATLEKVNGDFFNSFLSLTSDILPYLSVAYIFLLFFLMARLFTAYRHVHFISNKNLMPPPAHLEIFASKAALKIAIPKKIKVWISHHIEVPATIGFIKPVILIPFASINHLTVHQLEAIILHELSHIKRNDYLVNLLVSIVETTLFFNPFIAFFVKIVERERENCCDDFVLQYHYDPHSYASALLRLEQSRKNNIQLALGAVSGKKQLLTRIKRITGTNTVNQFNYRQKLLALLITTGIFCSLAWLSPSGQKKEAINLPPKTIDTAQKSKLETITIINDHTIEEITDPKKEHQEIQNNPEINKTQEINTAEKDEKNKPADKDFFNKFWSSAKNPLAALKPGNFNSFVFKNAPKIQFENFGPGIEEINKGLKEAYTEISKINWNQVQSDIDKSFSELKMEELPEKQKAAIAEARKYLSLINLNKQLNTLTILKEVREQQKTMADSLRVAGTTLMNQHPARLAEKFKSIELNGPDYRTHDFVFSYDSKTGHDKLLKRNGIHSGSEKATLELNGNKVKINIQTNPTHTEPLPRSSKKIKRSQRIIIEI